MKESIEERVDALTSSQRQVSPKMTRTKRMLKWGPVSISPVSLALVVGAVLTGSLFTAFYVNMTGDIALTGTTAPLFYYDGDVEFIEGVCDVPVDVIAMSAGDTFLYEHSVRNADNGAWSVVFDTSAVTFTDPMDPFFGFYFEVVDMMIDDVPIDDADQLIIDVGETAQFTFSYSLDAEFVDTDLPLPFDIQVVIERFTGLVAYNDEYSFTGGSVALPVMENDKSYGAGDFLIDSVTQPIGGTVAITGGGSGVSLTCEYPGTFEFTYTILDTTTWAYTDTAAVTVIRTA